MKLKNYSPLVLILIVTVVLSTAYMLWVGTTKEGCEDYTALEGTPCTGPRKLVVDGMVAICRCVR